MSVEFCRIGAAAFMGKIVLTDIIFWPIALIGVIANESRIDRALMIPMSVMMNAVVGFCVFKSMLEKRGMKRVVRVLTSCIWGLLFGMDRFQVFVKLGLIPIIRSNVVSGRTSTFYFVVMPSVFSTK